jgi:hypothetical protein
MYKPNPLEGEKIASSLYREVGYIYFNTFPSQYTLKRNPP